MMLNVINVKLSILIAYANNHKGQSLKLAFM